MHTTQQFSIAQPDEKANLGKIKVAGGGYATESKVIRDRAVESWLHQKVGSAYDALKADPTRAISMEQVRERLAALHKKTTATA